MSSIRPVTVRDVTWGRPGERPAVIVPVLGSQFSDVADVLARRETPASVVEWRVDHMDPVDTATIGQCAQKLAGTIAGRPLLATVRTAAEGGQADMSDAEYGALVSALIASDAVDMVDVEFGRDATVVAEILAAARAADVPALVSAHNFAATPPVEAMVEHLSMMQDAGGDAVKLAVMPHDRTDVAALLQATATFAENYARVPAITMAMGSLGVVTRLTGHLFGSAATFASVGQISAPGQPSVADVHHALDAVGRAIDPG